MREIPPTAGLPLRWRDFLPHRGSSLKDELARWLQVDDVQLACSGTAALIVTLTALARLSPRRSVVIPAYTCPLVALAIVHCRLKPVLCDLRKDHFDLCSDTLAKLCGRDTLAIVPTHLGGRVAELEDVTELAQRVGATVVEDAAQSLGGRWRGRPVGSIGDVGFYSLAIGKGLTLYEGGVVATRDRHLRGLLADAGGEITPYRMSWEIRRLLQLTGYAVLYRPSTLSWVYGARLRRALKKGNLVQAAGDDFSFDIPLHRVGAWRQAIGSNAIKRLPAFLADLSAKALPRKERLTAIPNIAVMADPDDADGTWPYFMVLMPTERARDAVLSRLWAAGLGVSRLFIHALPDYSYLAPYLSAPGVPHARDFAARMLTVSNSPWLSEPEFEHVCTTLETCARA